MKYSQTNAGKKQGFTMIELIIVVAIISILGAAVFIAVDPARRLNSSRNARRWSDVNNILSALITYQADNNGKHYSKVDFLTDGNYYTIGTCSSGGDTGCSTQKTQSACVDLSQLPTNYLGAIPFDPLSGSAEKTLYYLAKNSNGTLTVGACNPEGEGVGGADTPPVIQDIR